MRYEYFPSSASHLRLSFYFNQTTKSFFILPQCFIDSRQKDMKKKCLVIIIYLRFIRIIKSRLCSGVRCENKYLWLSALHELWSALTMYAISQESEHTEALFPYFPERSQKIQLSLHRSADWCEPLLDSFKSHFLDTKPILNLSCYFKFSKCLWLWKQNFQKQGKKGDQRKGSS